MVNVDVQKLSRLITLWQLSVSDLMKPMKSVKTIGSSRIPGVQLGVNKAL